MRLASQKDKNIVVEIITQTFENNQGVNWLIRKGGNKKQKIRRLADYAFKKAQIRNGIYISSNEKGVAVCYKFNTKVFSFSELYYQLRFALTSINLLRLRKVLYRESYRKKMRPSNGEYYYFWFLGVLPGGEKAVFELKKAVFDRAKKENLPVYLETAVERNKIAYERFGCKTYHYWHNQKENIRFWFLKWEP